MTGTPFTPQRGMPAAAKHADPGSHIPVRRPVQKLFEDCKAESRHPGLWLDRFVAYPPAFDAFSQEAQKNLLFKVTHSPYAGTGDLQRARQQRKLMTQPGPAECWNQSTIWRLAAHLSRASALENGNACLHPLYGFFYLPGSGLKGMARAYAETVARPAVDNPARKDFDLQFTRIFGSPPQYEAGQGDDEQTTSGCIVFHDAWPTRWPTLQVDLVNNHHKSYYETNGENPPGDWESPEMAYFLAVKPGTEFEFMLAPLKGSLGNDLREAKKWLQGALSELGAGAKTAAGYGYFAEEGRQPPKPEGTKIAAPASDDYRAIWTRFTSKVLPRNLKLLSTRKEDEQRAVLKMLNAELQEAWQKIKADRNHEQTAAAVHLLAKKLGISLA